jgi:hypothetical protein
MENFFLLHPMLLWYLMKTFHVKKDMENFTSWLSENFEVEIK